MIGALSKWFGKRDAGAGAEGDFATETAAGGMAAWIAASRRRRPWPAWRAIRNSRRCAPR